MVAIDVARAAKTLITAMLLAVATASAAQDAGPLFDPVTGYRLSQYRGVIDRTPEGVTRIGAAQALMLWHHALFIDVTPAEGAVRSDDGKWHLAVPHATIPGAHWFPEAGRGVLASGIGEWFDRGVKRLSQGRSGAPVVIFCLADCWMSWNAALRLKRAGYRHVSWFANGIDGWKEAGQPLVNALPFEGIVKARTNKMVSSQGFTAP